MKTRVVKPDRPGGFLDFSPPYFLAREKMLQTINQVFRSFGYNPIETPIVEFLKVLTGEDETSKNIFHLGGRRQSTDESLALRFDHTVPLARFLSANPYNDKEKTGIRLPWRRMVVGPVFRADTPQKGRYRQFYQFDVDIAGSSSMLADAEIIAIIYETLKALGLERFVIKVNNRKVLNGLAYLLEVHDRSALTSADITKEIMRILDKIPKIGHEAVFEELCQTPNNEYDPAPELKLEAISRLKEYLGIAGNNHDKLIRCQNLFRGVQIAEEGIEELQRILIFLKQLNVPGGVVEIDFSVARGLDYYTGPVFEASLLDVPEFGSIFSGGRYNDLVKRFTGRELPAVGASIGVDRLFTALQQLGMIELKQSTVSDVLILRLANDQDEYYLNIANQLRKLKLNVEISLLDDTTFRAQFNFAINQGVNYVVIAGKDEISKNSVQIKNLLTRQQTEMPVTEVYKYFVEPKSY